MNFFGILAGLLARLIYQTLRHRQDQEEARWQDDEMARLRQEHRERLRGIPPERRSTRFQGRKPPKSRSDTQLRLTAFGIVLVPFLVVLLVICGVFVAIGVLSVLPARNASPWAAAPPVPPSSPPPQPPQVPTLLTLKTKARAVWQTRFSPDGNWVATIGEGSVCQLWDRRTGAEREFVVGTPFRPRWLDFSPDGRFIVAHEGDKILVRDAQTGDVKGQVDSKGVEFQADYACFASDSSWFTVQRDHGISFYGLPDAKLLDLFKHIKPDEHTYGIACRVTPDGKTLLTSGLSELGQGRVDEVWDLSGKQPARRLKGFEKRNGIPQLSPNGKLLLLYGIWEAHVLDWEKDEIVAHWKVAESENMYGAIFARDSKIMLTGHRNGNVRCWELPSGEQRAHFQEPGSAQEGATGLAVSQDGKVFASAMNDVVTLRQFDTVFPKK